MTSLACQRQSGFVRIPLRPGKLTEEEGKGTVALEKTGAKGAVRRVIVARVAMALLEYARVGTCWLDLLKGREEVEDAVKRCVGEQIDCTDGESLKGMARKQQ